MRFRWTREWVDRPVVRDAGLIAVLVVATVLVGGHALDSAFPKGPDYAIPLWWLLSAFALMLLPARRRFPLVVAALTVLVTVAHMRMGVAALPADLAAAVALFSAAVALPRLRSALVLTTLVAVAGGWAVYVNRSGSPGGASPPAFGAVSPKLAGAIAAYKQGKSSIPPALAKATAAAAAEAAPPNLPPPTDWGGFPVLALAVAVPWFVGVSTRNRQAYLGQLQRRTADLERERDQQAELAAVTERARISRELHDIVAHGLSVIALQAQGGAAVLSTKPDRTRDALGSILTTSRQSLGELRRLLATVDGDEPTLDPQPGLGALPTLIERIRSSGSAVTLTVHGDPVQLPAGVDLSAYRIVQESLTNAVKHAGAAATVTVLVRYTEARLEITVDDSGGTSSAGLDGAGRGLIGVTERVALLHGHVSAGPTDSGFRVFVSLPLIEVEA